MSMISSTKSVTTISVIILFTIIHAQLDHTVVFADSKGSNSKKCQQYGHSCLGGHGKRSSSRSSSSSNIINHHHRPSTLLIDNYGGDYAADGSDSGSNDMAPRYQIKKAFAWSSSHPITSYHPHGHKLIPPLMSNNVVERFSRLPLLPPAASSSSSSSSRHHSSFPLLESLPLIYTLQSSSLPNFSNKQKTASPASPSPAPPIWASSSSSSSSSSPSLSSPSTFEDYLSYWLDGSNTNTNNHGDHHRGHFGLPVALAPVPSVPTTPPITTLSSSSSSSATTLSPPTLMNMMMMAAAAAANGDDGSKQLLQQQQQNNLRLTSGNSNNINNNNIQQQSYLSNPSSHSIIRSWNGVMFVDDSDDNGNTQDGNIIRNRRSISSSSSSSVGYRGHQAHGHGHGHTSSSSPSLISSSSHQPKKMINSIVNSLTTPSTGGHYQHHSQQHHQSHH